MISIGQLAFGVVAVGQVGIGFLYGAGILGIGSLSAGILPLAVFGRWPLGAMLGGRREIQPVPRHFGRWLLLVALIAVVASVALLPLWGWLETGLEGEAPPIRR